MRTVVTPGTGPWLPGPSPPPEPWGPGAVRPEGTCTWQPLPGTDRVCPCLDGRRTPTCCDGGLGGESGRHWEGFLLAALRPLHCSDCSPRAGITYNPIQFCRNSAETCASAPALRAAHVWPV